VEKEKIPRNKLCGGGVTPKVLSLLDFSLPRELIERSVRSARIHVGDDSYDFETERTLVYMTSRAPFDAFLTEKASEGGAELMTACPVREVKITDSHAEVRTPIGSFRSHMIIGADGTSRPVASAAQLRSSWNPDQVAYAIESEVHVGQKGVEDFVQSSGYLDFFFGVSPSGYGWIFLKDDHLTVSVGCRLSRLRDGRGLFKEFVKRISTLAGDNVPSPQVHLIPLGGATKVPTVGKRVLLAGDSAGFAEPLFGEGIYFAVLSGQIAAEVAARACSLGRFGKGHLKSYEKQCHRKFELDFDVAYHVACFSYLAI